MSFTSLSEFDQLISLQKFRFVSPDEETMSQGNDDNLMDTELLVTISTDKRNAKVIFVNPITTENKEDLLIDEILIEMGDEQRISSLIETSDQLIFVTNEQILFFSQELDLLQAITPPVIADKMFPVFNDNLLIGFNRQG